MSDEQNKDSLLVDQKDALDFYFDALLLPDENDIFDNDAVLDESNTSEVLSEQSTSNTQENPVSKSADSLQADKEFLRASKLRQGMIQEKVEPEPIPEPIPEVQPKLELKPEHKPEVKPQPKIEPVNTLSSEFNPIRQSEKIITEGPISPKPRLKEPAPEKQVIKKQSLKKEESASQTIYANQSTSPEIVFSTKNNDGEVSEQILIPRSQRLAAAKKSSQAHNVAKAISRSNPSKIEAPLEAKVQSDARFLKDKKTLFSEKTSLSEKPLEDTKVSAEKILPLVNDRAAIAKKKNSNKQISSSQKEAPTIDLSLFLPKIKTLSEEEIAQQIEALTQAAVSQAQLESDLAHVAELEQVSQKILSTQVVLEKDKAAQNIDNAPSWAIPNFQVLLFTVAGLKLAVPLTELNGIVEWGDEYISELPGHKSWYLGIIQNQGKSVPVIDTLQQVVPMNRWPANYLSERKFKHIIMIDDSHWGLACETVLEVVTLNTDAVKWRSTRTKRRWLMGTVIEHMCALLDSSEFAAMLKTGDDSLMNT